MKSYSKVIIFLSVVFVIGLSHASCTNQQDSDTTPPPDGPVIVVPSRGIEWAEEQTPDGLTANSLAYANDLLYMGTVGHVYVSEDSGNTWEELGRELPPEEFIYDIRPVGDAVYVSVIVSIEVGSHKSLYYLAPDSEEWVSVGGLHQSSLALGDSLYVVSTIYGLRRFENGLQIGGILANYFGSVITNIDLDDIFYAYNILEGTLSRVSITGEGYVELLATFSDSERPYISDIQDFDGNLYVNVTLSGIYAYDLSGDFSTRTTIPVRDPNDNIDIKVLDAEFYVFNSDLYRSGGGSGGGAVYKLINDKFIGYNYTEGGSLRTLVFFGDMVCGLTNTHAVYCGKLPS
jgi:hypothetical protein